MPFFSIVVAAYNAEKFIEKTISSILMQSFTDYEVIVKDAGSTDRTLELIPRDERIHVFSCPDKGIYDGMNQGILKCSGNYITFLNCGDSFYDADVLGKVHEAISAQSDDKLIAYGNYFTKGMISVQPEKITRSFLFRRPMCHQTMFFSRNLFEEYGLYDLSYRVLADYCFTLKCISNGVRFYHTGCIVCEYLGDGFSTRPEQKKRYREEALRARKTYYSDKEIMRMNIRRILTLQKLRIYMASDDAPKWLRSIYRKIANYQNR